MSNIPHVSMLCLLVMLYGCTEVNLPAEPTDVVVGPKDTLPAPLPPIRTRHSRDSSYW